MVLLEHCAIPCALQVDILVLVHAVLVAALFHIPVSVFEFISIKICLRASLQWIVHILNVKVFGIVVVSLDNVVQSQIDILVVASWNCREVDSVISVLENLKQHLGSFTQGNLGYGLVVHLFFQRGHIGIVSGEHLRTFSIDEKQNVALDAKCRESTYECLLLEICFEVESCRTWFSDLVQVLNVINNWLCYLFHSKKFIIKI